MSRTRRFRFLDFREMHLANVPVMVNRVTYTGDLGYEIWVKPEYQRRLYRQDHGGGRGIRHRQFRHAGAALACGSRRTGRPGTASCGRSTARFEADAGRFVDLKKNDFIGREAAAREKEDGGKLRRVTFIVDAADADVLGDEPIWHDGKVVGWVTSGGYAHYVDRSLAQGYVPKELAANGAAASRSRFSASGARRRIQAEPLFDPEGARMRG